MSRHLFGARPRRLAALVALVVLAGLLGGCREDSGGADSREAAEYRRLLDASGQRIVLVDAQGQVVQKLRKRHAKYKVYDQDLVALGYVSWTKAEPDADAGAKPTVSLRRIGADQPASIRSVSEGTWEMTGHLRIEATDRGWAVFGDDGKLVGAFERVDDGKWQLRRRYDHGPIFTVGGDDADRRLLRDGDAIAHLRTGTLAAVEILAYQLDGLDPLEQTAVGVWLLRVAETSSE